MKFLFKGPLLGKYPKVDPYWSPSPEYIESSRRVWGMLDNSNTKGLPDGPTEQQINDKIDELECMLADWHGVAPKVAKEWAATLTPQQIDNRLFWHNAGWLVVAAVCGFVCAIGVLAL